jgi:hypothetical protein
MTGDSMENEEAEPRLFAGKSDALTAEPNIAVTLAAYVASATGDMQYLTRVATKSTRYRAWVQRDYAWRRTRHFREEVKAHRAKNQRKIDRISAQYLKYTGGLSGNEFCFNGINQWVPL